MPKNSTKTSPELTSLLMPLKNAVNALHQALNQNQGYDFSEDALFETGTLTHIVEEILGKKELIESTLQQHATPCYLLDFKNLHDAVARYKNAFFDSRIRYTHFYAVKLNHEPRILQSIFKSGFGADVSSARELELAKQAGAETFLFSGPGKTELELIAALDASVDLIINIDNFSELARLTAVTNQRKQMCKVGVRVNFSNQQDWGKFGIPIGSLPEFFTQVQSSVYLDFCGIQFHMSWNRDESPYVMAIRELGALLKQPQCEALCKKISFIDIGGGFRPHLSEGLFVEDTPVGSIISSTRTLLEELGADQVALPLYALLESVSIETYAAGIHQALVEHLLPIGNFEIFTEPGRILVNSALHVAVRVVDIKSDDCVITDGGTNIVGFERFEFDYFPVINLSHPSLTERKVRVYGSLCMPQDYWGLQAYSDKFEEGDIIIIPYQGALTYSTMNDFIKGRASVFALE